MFPEMLTGVPTGTSALVDMTAEFTPLLIGLYGLLVVCIGGLVLSSLSSSPSRTQRPMDQPAPQTVATLDVSEAA